MPRAHSSACFKTNYQSNNLGARDKKDYNKDMPKDSLLLIGDSFAMGINFINYTHYGVQGTAKFFQLVP